MNAINNKNASEEEHDSSEECASLEERERERDERESIDIWIFVIFVANQPPATSVRGSSD